MLADPRLKKNELPWGQQTWVRTQTLPAWTNHLFWTWLFSLLSGNNRHSLLEILWRLIYWLLVHTFQRKEIWEALTVCSIPPGLMQFPQNEIGTHRRIQSSLRPWRHHLINCWMSLQNGKRLLSTSRWKQSEQVLHTPRGSASSRREPFIQAQPGQSS